MNRGNIKIWDIPIILKRKAVQIVAFTVVCGIIMLIISTVFIRAQYTAETSLYIYSSAERTESENSEITSSEITTSQQLLDTYVVILRSKTVLNKVIQELDLDYSAEELKKHISASAIDNTEVLSISVEDRDPEQAQRIAGTIAEILPEELVRVVKAGGAEIVDYAEVPEKASSPNVLLNVIAGIVFGLFFSCGIVLLKEYFDTKVKGEEDIQAYFDYDIPVLGVIPMLNAKENSYVKK